MYFGKICTQAKLNKYKVCMEQIKGSESSMVINDFIDDELAIERYTQNCVERNVTVFVFVHVVV